MRVSHVFSFLALVLLSLSWGVSFAQEGEQPEGLAVDITEPVQTHTEEAAVQQSNAVPERMASLVFTYWEHEAIKEAQDSVGVVRAPTSTELFRDLEQGVNVIEEKKVKPPPEKRYVSLGGIVYASPDDWTIWLNGQRVAPKALPAEVIDLTVRKGVIELKWFDEYTNKIYPLRLRPHQRFNLDTRIFLSGPS